MRLSINVINHVLFLISALLLKLEKQANSHTIICINSKSGEKRYSEVCTSPIFDENKKVINVYSFSVKDITKRKRAQEALNQNKVITSICIQHISDM